MAAVGLPIRRPRGVAGVVGIVLLAVGAGCTAASQAGNDAAGREPQATCAPLQTGAPPVWARAGFTGDSYPPFATSSSGDVVALVFGDPLSAPPVAGRNNKILWVDRDGAHEMAVTARVEGRNEVTRLRLDVGPSIVDLPAAGCWHLDLRIGDRNDSIDLRWSDARAGSGRSA